MWLEPARAVLWSASSVMWSSFGFPPFQVSRQPKVRGEDKIDICRALFFGTGELGSGCVQLAETATGHWPLSECKLPSQFKGCCWILSVVVMCAIGKVWYLTMEMQGNSEWQGLL